MTNKMENIIKNKNLVALGILLLGILYVNSVLGTSNFKSLYDSISADFQYRYFHNSDFTFTAKDRQEVEALYKLDEVKNNRLNYALVQYLDAFISASDTLPNHKRIIMLVDQAIQVITKDKYPVDYAKLILQKSIIYVNTGDHYVEAYQYLSEILQLLDVKKEPAYAALTYNYLAILWIHLGEWDNALYCITKSENIFRENGYETTAFFVRSNACSIYLKMGNYQKAIQIIKEDLPKAEARDDTTSAVFLNVLLGNSYVLKNDLDSGYLCLNRALTLINEYHAPLASRKSDVLYSLGRLFFLKKDYRQAALFLEESLPYIRQSNLLVYENRSYYMLSKIYNYYGQTNKAYDYLEKSVKLRDSLSLQDKILEIQRIKGRTELMNYQQQLQITEQKAAIGRARLLLIILILLFVLGLIIFILFYINREKKLKELRIRQLDQQLKNDEVNNRLEKMKLEQQVEEKEREMLTTQLLMTERSKIFEQLLQRLKPLYETKKISEKVWKEIQSFIPLDSRKENEWEKSKIHFEKVHPDFFKKLKEFAPDITENEFRLSAYIKIGMRTKQIAEMLSIDQRSVITNRYNLKKKLNLKKDESLDNFIRDI